MKSWIPYWIAFFVLVTLSVNLAEHAEAGTLAVRAACESSESWSASFPGISNGSAAWSYLTKVPRSNNDALAKWKAMRAVQPALSAHPELKAAASYWYYRSAFQLGLYSLAEGGFKEIKEKYPDNEIFILAAKMCQKVLQNKFRGLSPKSPFVKHLKADQDFFKSLNEPTMKRADALFKTLHAQALRMKQRSRADALALLYAEELYRRDRLPAVEIITKKISIRGDRGPNALLLRAWTAFREKNYAQAVGHSYSLMKSYGQTFEALEGEYIAAGGFLEACMPKDGLKTLEYLKAQVLMLESWLKKEAPNMKRDPYGFYVKHIQSDKTPHVLKREWLRNGLLFENQGRLNAINDEVKRVRGFRNDPRFAQVQELEKRILANQNQAKLTLGVEFQKTYEATQSVIDDWIEKGQLLETDILAATGQQAMQGGTDKKMSGNGTSSAESDDRDEKVSITKKAIWTRADFNGNVKGQKEEVWLDDIGNYVGRFKNKCKPQK